MAGNAAALPVLPSSQNFSDAATAMAAQAANSTASQNTNVGNTNVLATGSGVSTTTAYAWIIAWLVIILALWFMAKTKLGHTVIYWTLVLMIVFVLVTQYQAINAVLAPFASQGKPATSATAGGGGSAGSF